MNYRVILRNQAQRDLRSHASYLLANASVDTAETFLVCAEQTFEQLRKMSALFNTRGKM